MYRSNQNQMLLPHEFFLPFGGRLNAENQWCRLAMLIPWGEFEERYAKCFKKRHTGQIALSVRLALGTLIIQNRKGLSDRDTVEEIVENPYLQYFIGLSGFIEKNAFDPSLMVHFRRRLGKDIINEVNEAVAKAGLQQMKKGKDDDDDDENISGNGAADSAENSIDEEETDKAKKKGKLILDATCTPADIHYPTDIDLLNDVRKALEEIIDVLHKPHVGKDLKPRTYRDCARRDYLHISKKRRKSVKEIRKAIGQQLRYVRRDLEIVRIMAGKSPLRLLNKRQYRNLLVGQEIYRQQLDMYTKRSHTVEGRIVSLHMPFIRPIVRGKSSADVEFGGKLAISVVNGFSFMEHLSFDSFNEGITLIQSVKNYRERFGYYPEAVIADKIYRNRDNLQYCKSRGIRLSGPPLGRPPKDQELLKEQKRQERMDAGIRNAVEGKFGEGKRSYGLNRIMARLKETSETVIAMQLLVMNLEHWLRILFALLFRRYFWLAKTAI
ncbi:MAG: IS5/IS1182 family transposase [Firmicutes bacterium HGW-Firmicutes-8]|nr:MAG: IS5/IS1182 family transposase [Firmicutes bacterium HGW-Firmicutes-8]